MCNYFNDCIKESMIYANNKNFDDAIKLFISNTSKSKCTKYVYENPLCFIILNQHMNNPEKFEYDLMGFELSLTCFCK